MSIEERLGTNLVEYHNAPVEGLEEYKRATNKRCEVLGKDLVNMELDICEQIARLKRNLGDVRLLIRLLTIGHA